MKKSPANKTAAPIMRPDETPPLLVTLGSMSPPALPDVAPRPEKFWVVFNALLKLSAMVLVNVDVVLVMLETDLLEDWPIGFSCQTVKLLVIRIETPLGYWVNIVSTRQNTSCRMIFYDQNKPLV